MLFLRRGLMRPQHVSSFAAYFSTEANREFDLVIVGGGIVGCATGRELYKRYPNLKLAIVEKENRLAAHQSSNNSGVIHAGIYYTPGSLKAKLCVRGLDLSYAYLDEFNLPYKKCGKLIVAVEPEELPRLDNLHKRALENGVRDLQVIPGDRIPEFEPHCRGLKALWSPHTGIVDWGAVTESFGKNFKDQGGQILFNHKISGFAIAPESPKEGRSNDKPLVLKFDGKPDIRCRYAVTCAGLHSDRIATLSGCDPVPKILPFRGEYLLLKPEKRHLVRGNIYPVPDPAFPFLGVHFTPRVNGDVWLGPNAVLAYAREGYNYTTVNLKDLADALAFRGMQKLMLKYLRFGLGEMYRGLWIKAQVKQLQRFVPELSINDVTRGPAGVRAQALDQHGNLVDDFVFDSGTGTLAARLLHVRNAPSPAATSSLAIAEMVVKRVQQTFQL